MAALSETGTLNHWGTILIKNMSCSSYVLPCLSSFHPPPPHLPSIHHLGSPHNTQCPLVLPSSSVSSPHPPLSIILFCRLSTPPLYLSIRFSVHSTSLIFCTLSLPPLPSSIPLPSLYIPPSRSASLYPSPTLYQFFLCRTTPSLFLPPPGSLSLPPSPPSGSSREA